MRAEPPRELDGESLDWLRRLGAGGGDRRAAELKLHAWLARIALAEVRRRAAGVLVTGPGLDGIAHQAVDDAMLAILGELGDFSGESRFTTWACRWLILEVEAQFSRRYCRHPSAALNAGHLRGDPRDAGCDATMAALCVYADLAAAGVDAAGRYPGVAAHMAACGPCAEDLDALLLAVTIG